VQQQRNGTFKDNHQNTVYETRAYGRLLFSLLTSASDSTELAFYHFQASSTGQVSEEISIDLNSLEPFEQLSNMTLREEFATRNFSEFSKNRFEKNRH